MKIGKKKQISVAFVLLLMLVGLKYSYESWTIVMPLIVHLWPEPVESMHVDVQDVLNCMAYGRWETRNLSPAEHSEITLFYNQVMVSYQFILHPHLHPQFILHPLSGTGCN